MKLLDYIPRMLFRTVGFPERRSSWLVSLTTICFLCGGLGAFQVRAVQQTQQLSRLEQNRRNASQAETLRELAGLRRQLRDNEAERHKVEIQLAQLKSDVNRNYVSRKTVEQLNGKLRRLERLAALTPEQGPGVVIKLSDNPAAHWDGNQFSPEMVHDFDIQQTVHELLSVKATAIAIKGAGGQSIRITGYTPIRCVGPAVLVNFQPVVAPYEIMVLGKPAMLKNALEIPNGIRDRARNDGLGVSIKTVNHLNLPAAENML